MIITLVHIGLSIVLFFIQNWIGSRAYSKGYIRFSLLDDKDEAHSANYVIKVFGPIVFLIITVALLQYFKLEQFTLSIINIVYYYLAIRVLLIFLYERVLIVNWIRIFFYYASIIIISKIIIEGFINSVSTLLPDFSQIKNEIWLLVIIFVYQLGNGFEERNPQNQLHESTKAYLPELKKRKRKYIMRKYKSLSNLYGKQINEISFGDNAFDLTMISILIFENFNRPRLIRSLERLWVRITNLNTTQGIMQTSSKNPLSDIESLTKGTTFLFAKYSEFKKEEHPYNIFKRTIKRHCPDRKYVRQILFIIKAIIDTNYKDSADKEKISNEYLKLYDEIKSEFDLYDYY